MSDLRSTVLMVASGTVRKIQNKKLEGRSVKVSGISELRLWDCRWSG
jgi:hypothetical protein